MQCDYHSQIQILKYKSMKWNLLSLILFLQTVRLFTGKSQIKWKWLCWIDHKKILGGSTFGNWRFNILPLDRDSWLYNSLRMARVWMDEYIEQFYKVRGNLNHYPVGELQARVDLRRKLKCRSFRWYLKSVYPELLASLSATKPSIRTAIPNMPNVLTSALVSSFKFCIYFLVLIDST